MEYFPLFTRLTGRQILILGGGKAAALKIRVLAPYRPQILLLARHIEPEIFENPQVRILEDLSEDSWNLLCCGRAHELPDSQKQWIEELVQTSALVVCAIGSKNLNAWMKNVCSRYHVWMNAVDQPDACDFIFPTLIQRPPLCIGISTSGASPTAARYLKDCLQTAVPEWMPESLRFLQAARPWVLRHVSPETARKTVFEQWFDLCRSCRGIPDASGILCVLKQAFPQLSEAQQQTFWSLIQDQLSVIRPEDNDHLKQMTKSGKVYLAGAGCGSREWLTLRTLDLLKECDVLIYDDLIAADILELFGGTSRIYVGKRKGGHSWKQENINALLAQLALEGHQVLRLKGGDPFIFGRGMEEIQYLRCRNIEYEVIPGISSCAAIPLRMEIPLTHRRMSRGFMVMTASRAQTVQAEKEWQRDIQSMADFSGTVVLLMGASKVESIARDLIQAGKDPQTPAALICSPSISDSQMVQTPLKDLGEAARKAELKTPGIIIVGDVVELGRQKESGCMKQKMAGFCGTHEFEQRISSGLKQTIQLQMLMEGCLDCDDLADPASVSWIAELVTLAQSPQGLVCAFTSRQASSFFLEKLRKSQTDLRSLSRMQIACIGPATAEPFEQAGLFPDWAPTRALTSELAREIQKHVPASVPVWLFRSAQGSDGMEKLLADRQVHRINLYNMTYKPVQDLSALAENCSVIAVGSAMAARSWLKWCEESGQDPDNYKYAVLSEVTGCVLEQAGIHEICMCSQISARGLADLLNRIL